ncbi:MAG: alpha/beta hydrolase [Deltaproteobacteria bacterium]|nr:alpha/beta hydrolase [Deltaproteobacteria bacterium]
MLHKSFSKGETRAVILIHGAGGNHLSMLSLFDYIKKHYGKNFNILVLDLPSHFRSISENNRLNISTGNIPVNKGIEYYAKTVEEIILKLFNKNAGFILIGHSMGAQICIKYASLFPRKTKKVMLIAGCHNTYIMDSFIKSLENSFDATIMIFLKDAYATFDKNILKNAMDDIKRTPPQIVINDFKYAKYFNEDFKRDIGNINRHKIFFDLVYSKKDRVVEEECVKELYEKLKNAKLNEIGSKNHIGLLFKNFELEKEIDKFLLT